MNINQHRRSRSSLRWTPVRITFALARSRKRHIDCKLGPDYPVKTNLLILCLLLSSCATDEFRSTSTSELLLRHSQLQRELGDYHFTVGFIPNWQYRNREEERDNIERELLKRCQSGDRSACPDRPVR
jgi:hypothetical protein